MPDEILRALAWAEYDSLAIDADLGKLRTKLLRAGGAVPAARNAAKRVRQLRGLLRQVLGDLDVHLTAAVDDSPGHVA